VRIWLVLLALLLAGCTATNTPDARHRTAMTSPTVTPPPSAPWGTGCDPRFERHTYRPLRLVRLKDCVTVTGTVVRIKQEPDGDAHIQFRLDLAFQWLMNAANRDPSNAITRGFLIIEPDCVAGPVFQADAQGPCAGAIPPPGYPLLAVGAHLQISGPWVLDTGHGHNEIHPVERVALAL
jgi:hypothetical protein